ncbi:MAG: hypothetical protein QG641_1872 [Candidatus Poribacteria bacterium]|nr:hypothetical protein [Candidatus Poribacteria bacterium]
MPNQVMLEQVKEQVNQLSWHDQLKLITHISEQLSKMPDDEDEKTDNLLQKQREIEAKRILARCEAVGRLWKGNFDVVEDIRQMRKERDEQIWQSK